jgi:hypothetical protein
MKGVTRSIDNDGTVLNLSGLFFYILEKACQWEIQRIRGCSFLLEKCL